MNTCLPYFSATPLAHGKDHAGSGHLVKSIPLHPLFIEKEGDPRGPRAVVNRAMLLHFSFHRKVDSYGLNYWYLKNVLLYSPPHQEGGQGADTGAPQGGPVTFLFSSKSPLALRSTNGLRGADVTLLSPSKRVTMASYFREAALQLT